MGQVFHIFLLLMTLIAEASLESKLMLFYFSKTLFYLPTFQLSFG